MSAKGFSTTLIHRGEGAVAANPLTTPIYETTTYVFENADAVRRYNEGGSGQYLYSRYENPTVVAVEQKLAAADGAEQALVFSSGMAATSTILLALLKAGDEVVCGAAIYGGTFHLLEDFLPKFGVVPRFVSVEDMREPERVISGSHAHLLVRVAEQPAPALRRREAHRAGVPREASRQHHRQHVRQPAQPAPPGDGCRPGDAERDEVSQRPQRRHGRRGVRRRRR